MITSNLSSEQTVFSKFMPHTDFVLSKDDSTVSRWFCLNSSSSRPDATVLSEQNILTASCRFASLIYMLQPKKSTQII